ncbi:hypothetical protein IWW45_009435, partial [Coemansia sp. RSA 485]
HRISINTRPQLSALSTQSLPLAENPSARPPARANPRPRPRVARFRHPPAPVAKGQIRQ